MSANRCYEPEEGPYKPVDIRRYTNFIRGLRVSGIMLFTQKIYMYDYIRTSFLTIKMQIKKIRHAKETGKKTEHKEQIQFRALLRTRSQSGQTEIKLRSHDAVTQHEALIYMYTYTKVIFSVYL